MYVPQTGSRTSGTLPGRRTRFEPDAPPDEAGHEAPDRPDDEGRDQQPDEPAPQHGGRASSSRKAGGGRRLVRRAPRGPAARGHRAPRGCRAPRRSPAPRRPAPPPGSRRPSARTMPRFRSVRGWAGSISSERSNVSTARCVSPAWNQLMARLVLASTYAGSTATASSYQEMAVSNCRASKYRSPSDTRTTASSGAARAGRLELRGPRRVHLARLRLGRRVGSRRRRRLGRRRYRNRPLAPDDPPHDREGAGGRDAEHQQLASSHRTNDSP